MLRIVFLLLFSVLFTGYAQSAATTATKPAENVAAPELSDAVARAEAAIAAADWKTAEATLLPWLAKHPDDARALFDAGYVADAEDRFDDAAQLYRRAIAANPKSLEAHLSLGLLLARQGKLAEARPELVAATALDAGLATGDAGAALKARAWRALAELDRPGVGGAGDAAEASKELLEALKLSPETSADTLLAANLAEATGDSAAAEAAYRRILAKNLAHNTKQDAKSVAAANAGLAHLLMAQKKYPEAEVFLRSALEQSPGDPPLTAQLATVLAAQDKAEALPLLQKLHADHPKDAAIARLLAEVLAVAGDPVASDRLYAPLLAAKPDDAALLVSHGQNLIAQLKYSEAFTVFDKATRVDPANADGWTGLAFAASKTNHATITLHALAERAKRTTETSATNFLWATTYDSLHQKAEAAAYYHHFLESSAGKFPDQEWQARQRLQVLEKKP